MYASYIIKYIYIYPSAQEPASSTSSPGAPGSSAGASGGPGAGQRWGAVNGVVWTLRYRDSWLYDSLWCFVAILNVEHGDDKPLDLE